MRSDNYIPGLNNRNTVKDVGMLIDLTAGLNNVSLLIILLKLTNMDIDSLILYDERETELEREREKDRNGQQLTIVCIK